MYTDFVQLLKLEHVFSRFHWSLLTAQEADEIMQSIRDQFGLDWSRIARRDVELYQLIVAIDRVGIHESATLAPNLQHELEGAEQTLMSAKHHPEEQVRKLAELLDDTVQKLALTRSRFSERGGWEVHR